MFVLVKNDSALAGGSTFDVWKGMVLDLAFTGQLVSGSGIQSQGVGGYLKTLGETKIFNSNISALQIAAHGIWGGTRNVVMGGKFKDGFMSAAVTKLVGQIGLIEPIGGGRIGDEEGKLPRTLVAGAIGGIVSEVRGSKFANGAYTAAFLYLLNAESKWKRHRKNFGSSVKQILKWETGFGGSHDVHNNDSFADTFRNADKVNQARDYWYNKVNVGGRHQVEILLRKLFLPKKIKFSRIQNP